jgi:hypothetical protein
LPGVVRKIGGMKTFSALTAVLLLGAAVLFFDEVATAQTDSPAIDATATITFQNDQSVVTNNTSSDVVGVGASQTVNVTVQLPVIEAGNVIAIEALDGGRLSNVSNPAIVGSDGSFSFTFQAGQSPGKSQVSLHDGVQETGLQFWVLDPQHPENNPPTINSAN